MTRTSFFLVLPLLLACSGGDGSDGPGGMGGAGGTAGASGASGAGGEGGGGVQTCVDDEDCDDENDCTVDTCGAEGTCETSPEPDETDCEIGICVVGTCEPVESLLPCTEAGIREAIELGGGPYGFACDGPQTIVTEAEISINNDVILDGLGNLTIDADGQHRTLQVLQNVTAELRRLGVTGGSVPQGQGGGVLNAVDGTLTMIECSVTDSSAGTNGGGVGNFGTLRLVRTDVTGNVAGGDGGGVYNTFMLTITDSSISGNRASGDGGGLQNRGSLTVIGCTVSGNQAAQDGGGLANFNALTLLNTTVSTNTAALGGGIHNRSILAITHSTFSNNSAPTGSAVNNGEPGVVSNLRVANTVIDGDCASDMSAMWRSDNYNLESPGDTCRFDGPDDLVDRSESDLALGPLQDNGGPTETHALMSDSDAVDAIPAVVCDTQSDQRGVARPQGADCDIGAYELEP